MTNISTREYPYNEGDVVVLGPEVFASADGAVICWKGENYVPQSAGSEAGQAEVDRLRDAIEEHRDTWQRHNGTDPNRARPADLTLWAALDA